MPVVGANVEGGVESLPPLPEDAPPTGDALPNTEAREMGGNPANPNVNVLADTKEAGLDPAHENETTVVKEEDAAASSVAAQNALQMYENQLAIVKRDNDQLRERDAATTSKMKELYSLLDTPDGLNVEDRVKTMKADAEAARERIGSLQIALGIGPGDDPERAAGALKSRNRLADVDPTSSLPAFGHLLLMTALARVSPLLRAEYAGVPTSIRTPAGDTWTSRLEETLDDEGVPIRLVVVRHEPGSYAFQEARVRKTKLDGDLATALRGKRDAEKRLGVNAGSQPADIVRTVKANLKHMTERVEEIQAEMKALEPLLIEPEPEEWRFNADLEGYALKAAA